MTSDWRLLPLSQQGARLPTLLVKHEFGSADYKVCVTDLTYIWIESLDRRHIIKRALDGDTSIDPSEGSDQLKKLLQNVQNALDGRENTALYLCPESGTPRLVLQVTASLPPPLQPLVWSIHLAPASQNMLTSKLLLPCLASLLNSRAQVSSLLNYLKDKDHVINRVTDKLHSSGIDLASVFPSAPPFKLGTKASHRDMMAKSVKGLEEFNEDRWRTSVSASFNSETSVENIIRTSFTAGFSQFPLVYTTLDHERWWEHLGDPDLSPRATDVGSSSAIGPKGVPSLSREESVNEDEFQRQPTPDGLKTDTKDSKERSKEASQQLHAAPLSTLALSNDSTTSESDDDLDAKFPVPHAAGTQARKQEHTTPTVQEAKPADTVLSPGPRKLGILGGKGAKQSALATHASSSVPDTSPSVTVISDAPSSYSIAANREPRGKPQGKLGRIGGKHAEAKSYEDSGGILVNRTKDTLEQIPVNTSTERVSSTNQQGLPSLSGSNRIGRQPLKMPETPSPVRETSQDRADRKRAELKRELEEKSKLQTKKKRKF